MKPPFTLDVPAFQKLLEAAWVLQCQRDLDEWNKQELDKLELDTLELDKDELSKPELFTDEKVERAEKVEIIRTVPFAREESHVAVAPSLTANVLAARGAETEPPARLPGRLPNATVVAPPIAAPIYPRANVVGALALAPDSYCAPLANINPLPTPNVVNIPAQRENETAPLPTTRREPPALLQMPETNSDRDQEKNQNRDQYKETTAKEKAHQENSDKKKDQYQIKRRAVSPPVVIRFKRQPRVIGFLRQPLPSVAYASGIFALLITVAFSVLLKPGLPFLTMAKAGASFLNKAAQAETRDASEAQPRAEAGSAATRTDPPLLGPSHLQVTDPATLSILENLSRYELQTLQRQAEYGDDGAALALGMAYETGRYVRQSCAQAARWVAFAAAEGNAAAQYNLALRYTYGDGVPPDQGEAMRWSKEAASHGYQKAEPLQDQLTRPSQGQ